MNKELYVTLTPTLLSLAQTVESSASSQQAARQIGIDANTLYSDAQNISTVGEARRLKARADEINVRVDVLSAVNGGGAEEFRKAAETLRTAATAALSTGQLVVPSLGIDLPVGPANAILFKDLETGVLSASPFLATLNKLVVTLGMIRVMDPSTQGSVLRQMSNIWKNTVEALARGVQYRQNVLSDRHEAWDEFNAPLSLAIKKESALVRLCLLKPGASASIVGLSHFTFSNASLSAALLKAVTSVTQTQGSFFSPEGFKMLHIDKDGNALDALSEIFDLYSIGDFDALSAAEVALLYQVLEGQLNSPIHGPTASLSFSSLKVELEKLGGKSFVGKLSVSSLHEMLGDFTCVSYAIWARRAPTNLEFNQGELYGLYIDRTND